jgi:PadR family transcriptional regulator
MKIENSKAQMRKGTLELCILGILAAEKEVYPSDIIKKMKEAQLIVVEGTLYPLLNRLKNGGLLEYNWVESKSGPPRKYYKLTELGSTYSKELKKTWVRLSDAVQLITDKI